jgi:hypothetical protein
LCAFTSGATYAQQAAPALQHPEPAHAGTASNSYNATYSDDELQISVTPVPSKAGVDQLIVRRPGKPEQHIPIEMHIGSITTIARVAPNRLVAKLTSTQPYAGIAIIELSSGKILDSFACYDPTISPDGRFLAYKKFYAPHFQDDPDNYSDFVMTYDLRKTRAENMDFRRLRGNSRERDADTVGTLVYPRNCTLQPYSADKSVNITYNFPSFLVWSPDSTKLIFMAEHTPAGTLSTDSKAEGKFFSKASVPSSSALQLVMVDFTTAYPRTSVLNLRECGMAAGPGCGLPLTIARFNQDSVTIGLGRTMLVNAPPATKTFLHSEFKRLQ